MGTPEEELGYQPLRLENVPIRPSSVRQLTAVLRPVQLPDERRELTTLGRLSPVANAELDAEGLPGWLSGFALGGVLYEPSRHPEQPTSPFDAVALPLSGFAAAEFMTNPLDVEFSEFAGAYLRGHR